jgi:hypothetical protein
MIVCHCNTIAHTAFKETLSRLFEDAAKKTSLKQAVGLIWRNTIDENRTHRNPFSCTVCFDEVAKMIQARGLFEGEQIPERALGHAACPRIAECGLHCGRV